MVASSLETSAKKAFEPWGELRTGASVPENGFYRVVHSQHRLPKEVTLLLGQTFPRCSKCAEPVHFELIRSAPSLGMSSGRFSVALYELPELEDDSQDQDEYLAG